MSRQPIVPSPTSRPANTLDLLQRLADQAVILRVDDGPGEPRIGMLETIREFGLERLAAHGEETRVRDAHAVWCVALAERAEPELAGPDQTLWVQRLEAEMGNVRAALDWLTAQGDAGLAFRLAGAIGWLWSTAPYLEEARSRLDTLLDLPDAERSPAALAKVLTTAGDVADWQGDQDRARRFYERALRMYRELGDRHHMASMLRGLGSLAIDRRELELAQSLLTECQELAQEVGNTWELAAASNLLGVVCAARGDVSTAIGLHEAAAEGWRRLEDPGHVLTALTSAGWVAAIAREPERAAAAFREALPLAITANDEWYISFCVTGAGALLATLGDHANAVTLLAAGITERERLQIPLRPHVQDSLDQLIVTARARLGGTGFTELWEAGLAITIATATTMAAGALAAIEPPAPETPAPFGLTRRERDVLRLLAAGQGDKAIAEALFVSRATASSHVASILTKLSVESRTGAAAMAIRLGLA